MSWVFMAATVWGAVAVSLSTPINRADDRQLYAVAGVTMATALAATILRLAGL